MRVQLVTNPPVPWHDDALEEIERHDRSALEGDTFPSEGVIEIDFAQHLVQAVLDHVGIIVLGVGQPLEYEHVADAADHRPAGNAQRIGAVGRVLALERFDIDDPGWVVQAKALLLAPLPIIRLFDGGFDVVRNGVVIVLGDLGQQAVDVDENAAGLGFIDDALLEDGIHPDADVDLVYGVEVEEHIGGGIVVHVIVDEQLPPREVLVPVAELHVEAAIDRTVVHLVVEPFAVRHGTAPALADGRRRRHPLLIPGGGAIQPDGDVFDRRHTLLDGAVYEG